MRRATAVIDHAAIAANLGAVAAAAEGAAVMAVVKADAYGHGAVEVARTVREAGAPWLGVALPSEALALRAAGDTGRMLAWLYPPGDPDLAACVAAGVDLGVGSATMLDEVRAAARSAGAVARVHAKADTGLSRNGCLPGEWPALVASLAAAQAAGEIELVGAWSHLANADLPGHPSIAAQRALFDEACEALAAAGLAPAVRHLANSAAALGDPACRYDLVRSGIALYGVDHADAGSAARAGLRAAMTVTASIAMLKRIPAGWSVSYGSAWTADRPTRIALLPLGYADGLPRAASGRAEVLIAGRRQPVVGRIAMDQCMVAIDDDLEVREGDEAIVLGDPGTGAASATEWAEAAGTIGYEIVTRMGPRLPREHAR